jgi:hypothetical protein
MFDALFKGQIAAIVKGEGELIEKLAFTGKALVDYALAQLNGVTVTVTVKIDAQPVKKAESPS